MHDEKKPANRNYRKRLLLKIAGIIMALLIIIPIGLNFYLKKKLPDLINQKTPYNVSLKEFSLDLFVGNLHIKDVVVKTKNPKDTTITSIKGTIKELEIKDLSVLKILFSKAYHAESLTLISPNLDVKLPKAKKNNKAKKVDFNLKNIMVSNGNITTVDAVDKPIFKGKNINIDLKDIFLNEDQSKIPVTFSQFLVNASDVVFTLNDFYRITASEVNAKNKVFQITKLHLYPIQKIKDHNAKNAFEFKSERFLAENFEINQDSLNIENTIIDQPNITIFETGKNITKTNKKDIDLKIDLKKIEINKGQLLINDVKQSKKASVAEINIKLAGIILDKNTVKRKLPFSFETHSINVSDIYLKANDQQEVKISNFFTDNKNIEINNVRFNPLSAANNKSLWRGEISRILIANNDSNISDKSLNLKASQINLIRPNITVLSPNQKKNKVVVEKKSDINTHFSIGAIVVENGKFSQDKNGKKTMNLGQIDARFKEVSDNKLKKENDLPFLVKSNLININNIHVDAGIHYDLYVKNINNNGRNTLLKSLHFKPKYSRKAFSKIIKKQEDLYDVSVREIKIIDEKELFANPEEIKLKKVTLDGLKASIYHDLEPPNDTKHRTLFSEKLRSISKPLFVDEVAIVNSYISYEEDALNNNKPGKFFMDQFNATLFNVGNGMIKSKPSLVKVEAKFNVFGTATSKVNWDFDVLNQKDDFRINGNISKLSAEDVNLFVRPYLNISLDGKINFLKFNYYGNKNGIKGQFILNYQDIYVNLINKKTGENKKALSKAVNVFIRNDSKVNQKPVNIDNKRDPERSFFNMLWKGIMEGLKKTLI